MSFSSNDLTGQTLSNVTLKEDGLKFHFVREGASPTEDMYSCSEKLFEFLDSPKKSSWITEGQCLNFHSRELSRKSVFILEKFDGLVFDFLKTTNALILGPRCVLSCLLNNFDVPNPTTAIYTIAMRNLYISASGLKEQEKAEIEKLVGYMGGYYNKENLNTATTHLITNTVLSQKYEKAATAKIKVMKFSWITKVWNDSKINDIDVDGDDYKKYIVRPFYNLTFTSTGLSIEHKNKIQKLIEENDGKYLNNFKSKEIDILIMNESGKNSAKYTAAIQSKKTILKCDWIFDSVVAGYALSLNDYKIDGKTTIRNSTPSKITAYNANETAFNLNGTNLSGIMGNCTVNETVSSITSNLSSVSSVRVRPHKLLLDNIKMNQVKLAGPFLDSCNIFLCGFNSMAKDKLYKILNYGSATRFDQYNSSVSHIIVGSPSTAELKELSSITNPSVSILKLDWLIASLAQKSPADERDFFYNLNENYKQTDEVKVAPPSPASKKNIQSMAHSFTKPKPVPKRRLADEFNQTTTSKDVTGNAANVYDEENVLLEKYMEEAKIIEPIASSTLMRRSHPAAAAVAVPPETPGTNTEYEYGTSTQTQNLSFLVNLKVCFDGFDDDNDIIKELRRQAQYAGATIVDIMSMEKIDYLIVPFDILQLNENHLKNSVIVNEFWFEESVSANQCIDIQFYHRPILIDGTNKPLKNINVVLSTYSGTKRDFLASLAGFMGASVYALYARKQNPVLICPNAVGDKYNGAIKWDLPIVTCEWLLECYKTQRLSSMKKYLVGDSICPEEPEDIAEEEEEKADQLKNPILTTAKSSSFLPELVEPTSPPPLPQPFEVNVIVRENDKNVEAIEKDNDSSSDEQLFTTPMLKHRRLTEIAGNSANKGSPASGSQTPNTPETPYDHNRTLFCEGLPHSDMVYAMLKEIDDNTTPRTRRRKRAMGTPPTPVTPEECKSPWLEEQRRKYEEKCKLKVIKSTPQTPWSEIKKNFWRKALGDKYESPPKSDTSDIDSEAMIPNDNSVTITANDNISSTSIIDNDCVPSSQNVDLQLMVNKQHTSISSDNVKQLCDFIKKRDLDVGISPNRQPIPRRPETQTQTQTQDLINLKGHANTNSHDIDYCEPNENAKTDRLPNRMQYEGKPIFNISCSNPALKAEICTKIISLKGEVGNIDGYDSNCTHIVCEKITRSERIFSSIAAGKWLLSLAYIEDSFQAGHFLNEDLYEWGNPNSGEKASLLNESFKAVGKAAYRWRSKLSNGGGAFVDFNVILHCSKPIQIKNLLEAGGGRVLDVQEPYRFISNELLATATHCVVDKRKHPLSNDDKAALKKANIMCVSVNFLEEYIISELVPDAKKFIL